MTTQLKTKLVQDGSAIIVASFTDEDGNVVVPNTISWSLLNTKREAVNNRDSVAVTNPAAEQVIVLQGDDLALEDDYLREEERMLILEGTYNSSYGSDLPLVASCRFWVQRKGVVTWEVTD